MSRKPLIEHCCINKLEIKRLRMEKKMLLEDVAKLAQVSRHTVWKLESYRFSIDICQVLRIADALGVDHNQLILKNCTDTIID